MNNFCVLPWYGQEIDFVTGKESVCCWIQGNISRSDLQNKFLQNQKPQECQKCWQSEDRGIESRRQMENRFLDFKMDRDIASIEKDAVEGTAEINTYQLFVGSTCNGTCVTCGPNCSSAWRQLHKNPISIKQENFRIDNHFDQYLESINWKNAKRFNLLGGEPLLIDRSFFLLQKLLDVDNTHCRISFVSNGSVPLSKKQIDMIQHFSDISCCVSIDGIEKSFEYIRYPLSWQKLLDNLKQYREIFSEVIVSFTVSNLNHHEKSDITQWFREQGLLYIENYVVSPPWFNHNVVPGHPLWPKFVQEIIEQDKLKGIRIQDYLPHIANLIDNPT